MSDDHRGVAVVGDTTIDLYPVDGQDAEGREQPRQFFEALFLPARLLDLHPYGDENCTVAVCFRLCIRAH